MVTSARTSIPAVVAALVLLVALTLSASSARAITIATFADPAPDDTTPLFTVTFGGGGSVVGGWDDSQTGLDLQVPITGPPVSLYQDAFFTMSLLTYSGDSDGGPTGPGTIKFFEDNDDPATAQPLVMFSFDSARIDPGGLYADNIFHSDNVQVTIKGYSQNLTDQQFSFAFANKNMFPLDIGFTATASFTSSAIPEPATILLLALGSFALLRKRKH